MWTTKSPPVLFLGVMGSIVGTNQTCGVPGRTISENLFLIRDLIDYVDREELPVALLSLNQEKAFDRVDWGFLLQVLDRFNFSPEFCRWIRLFYTNVESAVVINGWTSSFFSTSRGVRQGCPLLPLLYVLSIEVLAAAIRTSPEVEGVLMPQSLEQFKFSRYADDTTIAVSTDASIATIFGIYDQYGLASGAPLNRGKSKGMWLGTWKQRTDTPFGIQYVQELPLLGAVFSALTDYSLPTWEPAVAKLEKRLSNWLGRRLSFQGKAVVINMLGLSQIWHLCHVLTLPQWAVKQINKAIWSFFWSGKRDLVARKAASLPKSRGRFGVIDVELKAEAFILQWVKRYFQPSQAKWKDFFNSTFSSFLRVQEREIFTQPSSAFTRRQLNRLPPIYAKLIEAWRLLEGGSVKGVPSLDVSSASPLLVEHMSSKNTYLLRQTRLAVQPHCMAKFDAHYGPLPWPQIWGQLHLCPYDRPVTNLKWQIAHSVLYTGARLGTRFRIASVDPRCFCGTDNETLEHLFFECELAR